MHRHCTENKGLRSKKFYSLGLGVDALIVEQEGQYGEGRRVGQIDSTGVPAMVVASRHNSTLHLVRLQPTSMQECEGPTTTLQGCVLRRMCRNLGMGDARIPHAYWGCQSATLKRACFLKNSRCRSELSTHSACSKKAPPSIDGLQLPSNQSLTMLAMVTRS